MWLKCSACKDDIDFETVHWVCSVSTCNRRSMRLVFCSVSCWDSHVAMLRHRDAWAVEARSPTAAVWAKEVAAAAGGGSGGGGGESSPAALTSRGAVPLTPPPVAPATRIVVGAAVGVGAAAAGAVGAAGAVTEVTLHDAGEREMLIVISKMKKYIKDRSGFNCSDAVGDVLSEHVRAICDEAIRAAGRDDRKTVLDRDVPRPRR